MDEVILPYYLLDSILKYPENVQLHPFSKLYEMMMRKRYNYIIFCVITTCRQYAENPMFQRYMCVSMKLKKKTSKR